MGEQLVPVLVRLPPDLHDAVKVAAAAEERSMAGLIRYALRQHLAASLSPVSRPERSPDQ